MDAVGRARGMSRLAEVRLDLLADEELMVRVREDDPRALSRLFDRYRVRLFGFLYRLLGDRGAAEDLLGETFLRVYRGRASFRGGAGFAAWAYRIARNLAIQELRHRAVVQRAGDQLRAERIGTEGPADDLEREELRAAVVAALASLPEEQRSAAILREYEGMDYRQIAVVLGCTEQAARARTYRARLALRAALAEHVRECDA